MRFLIDEQLPPSLVAQLISLGHDAEHVNKIGLGGRTDAEIYAHAVAKEAVIISKDEDFAARAGEPASNVKVVWIRLGNVTNVALWQALEPRMAEIVESLERDEHLIEIV